MKANLKTKTAVSLNIFQPTNAERLIAWQQRMQRHNRAQRHGVTVEFPLPIART